MNFVRHFCLWPSSCVVMLFMPVKSPLSDHLLFFYLKGRESKSGHGEASAGVRSSVS